MNIARRRMRVSVEMTSLPSVSDIAFLLLIFFLVSTSFAMERGLTLSLPKEGASPASLPSGERLVLRAADDGEVRLDGAALPVGEIEARVRERIEGNGELVVVLEADPRAEYGVMVEMLDQVKRAQAKRISLRLVGPDAAAEHAR